MTFSALCGKVVVGPGLAMLGCIEAEGLRWLWVAGEGREG